MNKTDKQIDRFLKRKQVIEILGENYQLTNIQLKRIKLVFEKYGVNKNIENMFKSLAIMIKYDLSNYIGRIRRLKGIPGTTQYTQMLRYGRFYKSIYECQKKARTKNLKNTFEYWASLGYDHNAALEQIKIIQLERAKKAALKIKGTSLYSCRSKLFWINKGYSDEEANEQVRRIQVTNGIEYYKKKYPDNYKEKFANRISKWQTSLKDNNDYNELSFKKGHSVNAWMAKNLSYEDALLKYNKLVEHLQTIRRRPSNISQKMFDMLFDQIGETCFYSTKNYEYQIEGYQVDFYHKESKTVIEFYGDFFHRNPNKYDEFFECFGYTSRQKWEYDKLREDTIKNSNKVNRFIVIWESQFRTNPTETVNQILQELKYAN